MKRILLAFTTMLLLASCANDAKTDVPEVKAATDTKPATAYAYTIDHPDYWEINTNTANTELVLKAVKAYETGDTTGDYVADSLEIKDNNVNEKGLSKDILPMVIKGRSMMSKYTIKMQDWESVVSKDGKEEWVTLWYKAYYTTLDNKSDSVDLVNDFKMKGGKISAIHTYSQKLGPQAK
jgi:hypothetical protein